MSFQKFSKFIFFLGGSNRFSEFLQSIISNCKKKSIRGKIFKNQAETAVFYQNSLALTSQNL